MALGLTPRQRDLLTYLQSCDEPPSYDEMAAAIGLNAKSGIHRLVYQLAERGHVTINPGWARSVRAIEARRRRDRIGAPSAVIISGGGLFQFLPVRGGRHDGEGV